MAIIDEDMASISNIPDLCRPIRTSRSDALAIGRPRHCIHPINVPSIGEDVAAISGHTVAPDSVPDLHRLILGAGGEACAIGRPGHGIDISSMAAIGEDVTSI